MSDNKIFKTAETLVRINPGVFGRRMQIILALCNAGPYPNNAEATASWIVETANEIIERTEQ